MVTELRDYGNRKTLVLYTDDNTVYRNLKHSTKVIRTTPYTKEQNGRDITVGYDLYFDRKHRDWLTRLAGLDPD